MNLWTCRWRWRQEFFYNQHGFFHLVCFEFNDSFHHMIQLLRKIRNRIIIELNFFSYYQIIQRFKNLLTICVLSVLQVASWKEQDKIELNFHVLLFFNPMQRLSYLSFSFILIQSFIFHFCFTQFQLLSPISF